MTSSHIKWVRETEKYQLLHIIFLIDFYRPIYNLLSDQINYTVIAVEHPADRSNLSLDSSDLTEIAILTTDS